MDDIQFFVNPVVGDLNRDSLPEVLAAAAAICCMPWIGRQRTHGLSENHRRLDHILARRADIDRTASSKSWW